MDSALNNLSKSLGTALFRGRSGYLAQLASDPGTGTTFTLKNINDVTSFEVDMKIVFASSKTAANRAGGARTISAVNRDTGVITVSAALDAALAADDYVFAEGDNANGSGSGNKVLGVEDWLPSTAPSSGESFNSVDRSVDPTRLAGIRINIQDMNPEEGYVTVFSRQNREGGRPSHLFLNHRDHRDINISLGSKVVYEDLRVGDIGFQAIKINGPRGPVRVIADQDCPQGTGYSLDMRTWKLHSLKAAPMVLTLDGNKLSRETSADRWEARIAYFAQLATDAPGYNAVVTLTQATDM
jgi:hypothetical protein